MRAFHPLISGERGVSTVKIVTLASVTRGQTENTKKEDAVRIAESEYPEWLKRYLRENLTLEDVASIEGITREGVRQRIRSLGLEPRSTAETRRLQQARAIAEKSEEIRSDFLSTRNLIATANNVDLPVSWVRDFVEANIPDSSALLRAPRLAMPRFSEDDLLESLREAAQDQKGNLSSGAYADFVTANPTLHDGRPRPGKQVMALRYGSWRAAMEAANLPSNPHGGPSKTFDETEAISAVVECWRSEGSPPSVSAYEEWQQSLTGFPSGSTVRKLAGAWNVILLRAWQIVHGITLDQNDENAIIPKALITPSEIVDQEKYLPYIAADTGSEISLRSSYQAPEYNALERAVRSHATIQNEVARIALSLGLTPLSPALGGPAFDVALESSDSKIYVVEVKSATPENLEMQMRIALGQVLRYCGLLQEDRKIFVPAIAIELDPDLDWRNTLESLGVSLLVEPTIKMDIENMIATHDI